MLEVMELLKDSKAPGMLSGRASVLNGYPAGVADGNVQRPLDAEASLAKHSAVARLADSQDARAR
jgi:hypothetical protein